MKALLVAVTMLAGLYAQANVKPIGTIVPYLCSTKVESDAGISSICFGRKTGLEGTFVSFQYVEDGEQKRLDLPVHSMNPGNSGITGELRSLVVSVLSDDMMIPFFARGTMGEIETLDGELYGRQFSAEDFHPVLTTM